jgi:hypothetical protein
MTERSSGQGRADDWARGYGDDQYAGEQYSGEQYSAGQYSGEPYPGASYSDETYFGPDPRAAGQGMPGPGTSGQGTPGPGPGGQGAPGPGMPAAPVGSALPRQAADSRSFLSALFDFSFTSFVTVRIIKVLYVLILILTSLYALVFTIVAFKAGPVIGLATLLIGDPLFIIIVMAFWRLVLESFVVIFRIAEDTREIRERGENR